MERCAGCVSEIWGVKKPFSRKSPYFCPAHLAHHVFLQGRRP